MNIEEVVGLVQSTLSDKGIIIDRVIKDDLVEFVESHSKIDAHSDEVIHVYHENDGFEFESGLKEKLLKDLAFHSESVVSLRFIYSYDSSQITLAVEPVFYEPNEAAETECYYSDGLTISYLADFMKEDYDLLEECLNSIENALEIVAVDYYLDDDYSSTVMEFLRDNNYEREVVAEEYEAAAFKILQHPNDETLESLAVARMQLYDLKA
jgi:hypothetical protein